MLWLINTMNKFIPVVIVFCLFMLIDQALHAQKIIEKPIEWRLAAKLQNTDGTTSTGFAGAINGVCGNVLIVAGGANFPGKLPWEGGTKHYSDEIHILQKQGDKFEWNKDVKLKLPEPVAYCGNISTPYGILYAGGENDMGLSNKAYLLNWNPGHDQLEIKELPNLPLKITNVALTNAGSIVYAAGGDEQNNSTSFFYCIDLKSYNPQWRPLPRLPLALANTTAIAQKADDGTHIFIIGGRTKTPSGISGLHHTVFEYNTSKCTWRECAGISDGKNTMNLSAGAGISVDKHFILITGGDNGVVFHKIETYLAQISQTSTAAEKEKLTIEKNKLNTDHKGFYRGILLYDTRHNKWTKIGELPFPAHVTTTATKWGKDIVLSNGEIKPGVRTPDIMIGKINITEKNAE